jgi:cell division transport system ATP-binding protein
VIRFDQVHKRYANGREALAGVSFAIEDGEMTFLTGHSGAGKSSILKLIALIERPTRGQVIVGNQNTAGVKPRGIPLFRRQLGVVFQDHKLLHDRPVAENVALPLIIAGLPRREIDKRVRAALDQVGLLAKEQILHLFKRFNDVGVTVVIATHDLHLIDRFDARRIAFREGRVEP